MRETLFNCYDSHTHFWATGQVASGLRLHELTCAEDVSQLKPKSSDYRAQWLTGFGWNQNNWSSKKFPDKEVLDRIFGNTPVFFSRVDGHASWINSAAISELEKLGYDFKADLAAGVIQRGHDGQPSGLLLDQAHINALLKLPAFSAQQDRLFFESSQTIFNRAGFTHVRDLSMNSSYWQILKQMEDAASLTVALDAFITVENLQDLERVLAEVRHIRKSPSQQMRLHGVKIFIDGSLGSKTAFLSEDYINPAPTYPRGLLLWSPEDIRQLLRLSWVAGEQVAIHCIGDAAVTTAVMAAREVSAEGILGRLHLEHVQVLSASTLQMMKPLHITCHLQPCHWLSDSTWLKSALSDNLIKNLFQWELLRKNKIPFDFGSDSPIETPSLFNTRKALIQSAKWGVPELKQDWKSLHSHVDSNWCSSRTEIDIEAERVLQVYFKGETLL